MQVESVYVRDDDGLETRINIVHRVARSILEEIERAEFFSVS
jgi:hypothetical protein